MTADLRAFELDRFRVYGKMISNDKLRSFNTLHHPDEVPPACGMAEVDHECELQFANQASFDATIEKYADLEEELSSACQDYARATTASTIANRLHFRGIDRSPEPCCVCLSTDMTSMLRFQCGHHVCAKCYVGCYLVRNMTPCFLCNDARTTTTPKTPITCQSGIMHTLFLKRKVRDWIAYFVNIAAAASNPHARGGLVTWLDFTLRMAHPRNAVETAHMKFAMDLLKPLKETVLPIALYNILMTTFYSNIRCAVGPSFIVNVGGKSSTIMVDKISRNLESHVMSANTQLFIKQVDERMTAGMKSSGNAPPVQGPTTETHTKAPLRPHKAGSPPAAAQAKKQPVDAPFETPAEIASDDAKMKVVETRLSSLNTHDATQVHSESGDVSSFFDVSQFSLPEYALIFAGLIFAVHKL